MSKLKESNKMKRSILKYKIESKKNRLIETNREGWRNLKSNLSEID